MQIPSMCNIETTEHCSVHKGLMVKGGHSLPSKAMNAEISYDVMGRISSFQMGYNRFGQTRRKILAMP